MSFVHRMMQFIMVLALLGVAAGEPIARCKPSSLKKLLAQGIDHELAVNSVVKGLCERLPSQNAQCVSWMNAFVPATLSWMRSSSAEEQLCALKVLGRVVRPDRKLLATRNGASTMSSMRPLTDVQMDRCQLCKLAVDDARALVADTTIQQQLLGYTKAVCLQLSSGAEACQEFVDQYGHMAFNLLLQALDAGQVCSNLGMCGATPLQQQQQEPTKQATPRKFMRGSTQEADSSSDNNGADYPAVDPRDPEGIWEVAQLISQHIAEQERANQPAATTINVDETAKLMQADEAALIQDVTQAVQDKNAASLVQTVTEQVRQAHAAEEDLEYAYDSYDYGADVQAADLGN